MNELLKMAMKFSTKPAVQRAIREAGKKVVDEIKEHGAELIKAAGHVFGV